MILSRLRSPAPSAGSFLAQWTAAAASSHRPCLASTFRSSTICQKARPRRIVDAGQETQVQVLEAVLAAQYLDRVIGKGIGRQRRGLAVLQLALPVARGDAVARHAGAAAQAEILQRLLLVVLAVVDPGQQPDGLPVLLVLLPAGSRGNARKYGRALANSPLPDQDLRQVEEQPGIQARFAADALQPFLHVEAGVFAHVHLDADLFGGGAVFSGERGAQQLPGLGVRRVAW